MSKRIAVCLSGHLRTPHQGYELFKKHVIDPNPDCEFDFFIDTWSARDWRKNDGVDRTNESLEWVISEVMSIYRPAAVRIQRDRAWNTEMYHEFIREGDVKKASRGEHIMGMYYKIFQCDSLRRAQEAEFCFQYDLVMRHRTDIAFNSDLILSDELVERAKSTIFVAKNHSDQVEWCSDVSAFSSSKGMLFYSCTFPLIPMLVEKHEIFRPEPLLYHHLKSSSEFTFEEFVPDWHVIKES